jgi:hypothetical protein
LPPDRNLNAEFLRRFFAGEKCLLKQSEVLRAKRIWNFREATLDKLWESYPLKQTAIRFLPDTTSLNKLDKEYVVNVYSIGPEYSRKRLR